MTLYCGLDEDGNEHFIYGSLYVYRMPVISDAWYTMRWDEPPWDPEGVLDLLEGKEPMPDSI